MQIYYLPDGRLVEAGEAFTLLDASLEAGIPHTHICGGNARCSTCRVMVTEGQEHCGTQTIAEQEMARRLGFPDSVRLACQTKLAGSGKISVRRLSLEVEESTQFFDQAIGKLTPGFMGQEKEIAILFADIRGFTSFSEALLPYDVIYVLNRYFRRMAQVIGSYGGTINVYMGDGLMALFGVEPAEGQPPGKAVEQAIRAGLDMLEAVEDMNPSLESFYNQRLRIGIGVHYGWTVIGTIGDPKNPNMTAIGDAVNLASRIEAANKPLGTTFLISEDAYQQVDNQVLVKQQFQTQLPGKSGEYCLYEVVGMAPPVRVSRDKSLVQREPIAHVDGHLKRIINKLWQALKNAFGAA
ncbi:adenylate/guanylate cyclase domain-containing protein [Stenomitos frigidus ULC18]|uniref:Adenylate/guanylate cyclase domain-containing protein n=1 Tax=Stenomitos frigidus ULC18 TaxID=2107698 RepID=A0A2T1DUP4_9CYAN|nr:adenylate/guanylate cyclase domain-containing protein [Stenomitos frigidus ULC18]